MAYVPSYTASDIAPITFDIVGTFGAALAGQMGPIAQIVVLGILFGVLGGAAYALRSAIGAGSGLFGHKK